MLVSYDLQAGGWLATAGKGMGISNYLSGGLWPDQHYTDIGLIDPNQTTGIFNTTLYAEYGFTDRITGIVNFPLFSRSFFNNQVSATTGEIITPGEAINGVGDAEVGVQYGLYSGGGWAISASLKFGLPFGEDAGGTAGTLQTGDGEFNQILRVDVGKSFQLGQLNAYANAYGGFNNRTNGFF